MKKLAYFDCPTGISGDMCLGALVDAGLPLDYLQQSLAGLGLSEEYDLRAHLVTRNGQAATKVEVALTAPHASHRHLKGIEALIEAARLPNRVTQWSLAIFRRLAEAEGAVHGIAPEQVHFHEVGATDAIVDIVGACIGLDYLAIDIVACSALPVGGGRVKAAHGWLPVPAPAVLRLLQMAQVPLYSNGIERELVTPTGAAIATTLAQQFGSPPAMTLRQVGLGAGGRDLPIPNILRLWIGEVVSESQFSRGRQYSDHNYRHQRESLTAGHDHGADVQTSVENEQPSTSTDTLLSEQDASGPTLETVVVLETQVDDLSPQVIGYLYDRLFAAGALDVFYQTVGMKKSRPGFLVTVIGAPEDVDACEQVLFAETTTLGVRRQLQQRHALHRVHKSVTTPYGSVRLKLAYHPQTQALLNVHPEYEDCAALAQHHQVPWLTVHRAALGTWDSLYEPSLAASLRVHHAETDSRPAI
ncbi:nickel pincer cofactor biosynthesis protein LarC [filamentous cyanobacterium CCP5]|nr:nickel pincer cofactor biosynthesis protein LarC [filamentous cyanobacterium CCP5]